MGSRWHDFDYELKISLISSVAGHGVMNQTKDSRFEPLPCLADSPMYLFPVNTKHLYNICAMLDQRRRNLSFRALVWQVAGSPTTPSPARHFVTLKIIIIITNMCKK